MLVKFMTTIVDKLKSSTDLQFKKDKNKKMMIKKFFVFIIIICVISEISLGQQPDLIFKSSDTTIENTFTWAKEMALSYVGEKTDPVGPWYEAALPGRFAFCMRDVSHQSIGAEILGLAHENKNMFTHFAKNISDSKDWCSYWEINKWGKPAPADYKNDKEFWYNLPANFDVIAALWKLYLWTGDKEYIKGDVFTNFYKKSLNEYIKRWVLSPDSLLTRPSHPNAPVPFDEKNPFHVSRGLPSYAEGVPNMKIGVDLIAGIYRALLSYSSILSLEGNHELADKYRKRANEYQRKIYENWWDNRDSLYYTYYSGTHTFGRDQGEEFLIWFDALKNKLRKQKTIEYLISSNMNVESASYMPLMLYKNGYWQKAYDDLLYLSNPNTKRRTYPEVSFGVIEGIVEGLMGVEADARTKTISTLYRIKNVASSSLMNLPILGTRINITHKNARQSSMDNNGKSSFIWEAMFVGNYHKARVGVKNVLLKNKKDQDGLDISYLDLKVEPRQEINISVY